VDRLLQDLRFATRLLWRDRTFAATSVLTLGICLAANIAMFSVVNSVLLNRLPVPESERLVLMYNSYPQAGAVEGSAAVPDLFDRQQAVTALEDQTLYRIAGFDVGERGNPQRLRGMLVSPSFFRLTRVQPAKGRVLTDVDGEPGQDHTVVISDALWRDLFSRDPDLLGRELRINGERYVVVGVMPSSFLWLDPEVKLWLPKAFTPDERSDDQRHSNNWTYLGRLGPGATLEQAQAQVNALNAANLDRFPELRAVLVNAGFHTVAVTFRDHLVKDVRGVLFLLWGAVGFVLVIGCVNVANLALVRSTVRLRELATRMALGAGRSRMARQLLTESVLLAALAGLVGFAGGYAAVEGFRALGLEALPRGGEIAIDRVAVGFTVALTALVGLLVGGIPLAYVLNANVNDVLREQGRSGSAGRRARAVRYSLVAAEVALACLLLIGAGLLLASFQRVLRVDPGFEPRGVLTASIALPPSRYADDAARVLFVERALAEIRALPGVEAAGLTSSIPFGGSYSDSAIVPEDRPLAPGESVIAPNRLHVTPGYLEAMKIQVARGRPFDARDAAGAPRVALVDEELARRFWKDRDPIGRRFVLPSVAQDLIAPGPTAIRLTVVGVVRNVRLQALTGDESRFGAYYLPYAQDVTRHVTLALRTGTSPDALIDPVRARINALDPDMPVYGTRTMEERMAQAMTDRRTPLVLALGFGATALLLSAIGIYGVLSFLVAQRRKEIGIRLALGDTPQGILGLVVREALGVVALGLAAGVAGAWTLRHVLASQLYEVEPTNLAVYALVTGVLGGIALVACVLPGWRAARVSPAEALSD
jgi:predicted permease